MESTVRERDHDGPLITEKDAGLGDVGNLQEAVTTSDTDRETGCFWLCIEVRARDGQHGVPW